MAVSVIINNYNYGKFIGDAIESALKQDVVPAEIIIVDDGSTDDSRQVIARYATLHPGRIIPIYQRNGGQASAMNAGFACATGDAIIFLDSDDMLAASAVRHVDEAFRANPGAAKLQYRMQVIGADGTPTGEVKPYPHLPLPSGDMRRQFVQFPGDVIWLPTSGNAFSARVLRKILPIPTDEFRILSDLYLCNIAPLFGDVLSLNEIGAYYRLHGNNNHETLASGLSLRQIRSLITHWQSLFAYTHRFAIQQKLPNVPECACQISSMTDAALRMISLKMARDQHPLREDRIRDLLHIGRAAAMRRFDVSLPLRLLYIAWLSTLALAPSSASERLAEVWMFPHHRASGLNWVLGRLHR